jgi:hypothetical protein
MSSAYDVFLERDESGAWWRVCRACRVVTHTAEPSGKRGAGYAKRSVSGSTMRRARSWSSMSDFPHRCGRRSEGPKPRAAGLSESAAVPRR